MVKILVPKTYVTADTIWSGVGDFFLFAAGPVRGGGNWQMDACKILDETHGDKAKIAVPCRWSPANHLAQDFMRAEGDKFRRQLEWEQHYLKKAGTDRRPGCVMFWLPRESCHSPHEGPEPYAMDTRGELGEWRMRMATERARVVVGAMSNFYGLSQIQRNFSAVLGYDFPIYQTLEETVAAAVRMAHRDQK